MKKFLLFFLLGLFVFDVDAQLLYKPVLSGIGGTGFSQDDEFSVTAKKKKRKKSKKRKGGKGRSKSASGGSGLGVGGGLMAGIPIGNFGKEAKTGFGVNLDADYFLTPQLSAGISTGYYNFKYDKKIVLVDTFFIFELPLSGKVGIMPFQLKANYYFGEGPLRPYVGLNLGLFINNLKYEYTEMSYYDNPVTGEEDSLLLTTRITDKNTSLAFAPNFGVLFSLADNLSLNINARYQMFWMNDQQKYLLLDKKGTVGQSFLGLNFGLVYTLGN